MLNFSFEALLVSIGNHHWRFQYTHTYKKGDFAARITVEKGIPLQKTSRVR